MKNEKFPSIRLTGSILYVSLLANGLFYQGRWISTLPIALEILRWNNTLLGTEFVVA